MKKESYLDDPAFLRQALAAIMPDPGPVAIIHRSCGQPWPNIDFSVLKNSAGTEYLVGDFGDMSPAYCLVQALTALSGVCGDDAEPNFLCVTRSENVTGEEGYAIIGYIMQVRTLVKNGVPCDEWATLELGTRRIVAYNETILTAQDALRAIIEKNKEERKQ